jgi:hypothetical protein
VALKPLGNGKLEEAAVFAIGMTQRRVARRLRKMKKARVTGTRAVRNTQEGSAQLCFKRVSISLFALA